MPHPQDTASSSTGLHTADSWESAYPALRRIAGRIAAGEPPGHTLQPTAIVHEAYLRLCESRGFRARSPSHLMSTAVRVMRRLLVDHARRKASDKRGGSLQRVTRPETLAAPWHGFGEGARGLDAAISELRRTDPDGARLVALRFFEGLTLDETADRMGVSRKTVVRRWRSTKAWLGGWLDDRGGSAADRR